ncbi:hypothetical protein JXB02_03570 [Candidatus Woesearchaeota archaeon]|nr:hypothetical protein [Candidatus Woesearchaeota archaeon]
MAGEESSAKDRARFLEAMRGRAQYHAQNIKVNVNERFDGLKEAFRQKISAPKEFIQNKIEDHRERQRLYSLISSGTEEERREAHAALQQMKAEDSEARSERWASRRESMREGMASARAAASAVGSRVASGAAAGWHGAKRAGSAINRITNVTNVKDTVVAAGQWTFQKLAFLGLILIIVFLVAYFGPWVWVNYGTQVQDAILDLPNFVNNLWQKTDKQIQDTWEKQFAYATGDYFTGEVEDSLEEPIGVYLEDMEQADQNYKEGEPVIVWATVRAKTLRDTPVTILFKCNATEYGHKTRGAVVPDQIIVLTQEEEDVLCTFDNDNLLEGGVQKVLIAANFTFKTMAYVRTYFMDQDRLRSMLREDIDIAAYFGLIDLNPIAIYTPGPISLGMDTKEPPIGIATTGQGYGVSRLGVTIDNAQDGVVKKIRSVKIYVPDSMDINIGAGTPQDRGLCSHAFVASPIQDQPGYNAYELSQEELDRPKEFDTFQSFSCRVNIQDPQGVLNGQPIAIQYFKAVVEYDYELQETINVRVMEDHNDYIQDTKDNANCNNRVNDGETCGSSTYKVCDFDETALTGNCVSKCVYCGRPENEQKTICTVTRTNIGPDWDCLCRTCPTQGEYADDCVKFLCPGSPVCCSEEMAANETMRAVNISNGFACLYDTQCTSGHCGTCPGQGCRFCCDTSQCAATGQPNCVPDGFTKWFGGTEFTCSGGAWSGGAQG